jgi:hypothetical protein
MDVPALEKKLTRVIRGQVASIEALAIIAETLLVIVKEIEDIAEFPDESVPRSGAVTDDGAP